MPEHYKMFKHEGAERTEVTDRQAEELAAHALADAHPGITDITHQWVRHHQPDVWLLFTFGHTEAEEP